MESLITEEFNIIKHNFKEVLKQNNIELISEKEKHSMVNLCLMEKNLNSSLSNNFLYKKREIINTKGVFVPICSLHIFNKKHTPKPKEFSFWNKVDREYYANELFNIINQN